MDLLGVAPSIQLRQHVRLRVFFSSLSRALPWHGCTCDMVQGLQVRRTCILFSLCLKTLLLPAYGVEVLKDPCQDNELRMARLLFFFSNFFAISRAISISSKLRQSWVAQESVTRPVLAMRRFVSFERARRNEYS